MAPLLLLAGTAISAAGAIQQGRAAEVEAEAARDQALFNAQVQENEARAQRQRAKFEQGRQHERAKREEGRLIAQLGFAGGLGSPVAEDLVGEQAEEAELENLLIGFEGEVAARRAESQAEIDRFAGRVSTLKGKNLKRASQFRAGSTLLTGFGQSGAFA